LNSSENQKRAHEDAIELVALSCLDSADDQALFKLYPPVPRAALSNQRQDEHGYGADLQAAITSVLDWILSLARSVPDGIAQDAVKFWLYTEVYKRISATESESKLKPLIERIKAYIEKQIK
jgi:hypothetical protein